jgi:TPR repeat protein
LINGKTEKSAFLDFFLDENQISPTMASSSSHSGIVLATLLEWYKIRDTFFGNYFVSQNIPLALELAARCSHPDAHWLTDSCAGKDVRTKEDAKRVFLAFGDDARALCFAAMSGDGWDVVAQLRRSAELGYAFAQASLVKEPDEGMKLARLAAGQGERDGFFCLGRCFKKDREKALENFLSASELGHVGAMERLGELLEESDPQRWRWWGRAAALGLCRSFLFGFRKQVRLFNSGTGNAAVMFAIGQALQGHVNERERTIFNQRYEAGNLMEFAKGSIDFCNVQIRATKDAMHAWTQVGVKLKVVKDVRKLIAKLIWDSREEALYTRVVFK